MTKGCGTLACAVMALLILSQAAYSQTPPPAAPERTWVDEVKNPAPWVKWGADLRLRWEYFDDAITLSDDAADHEWSFQRFRARTWANFTPMDNLEFNTRLMWEGRHWNKPDSREEWDTSDVLFDIFNAKIGGKDLPLTATLGRQELIFGDGWLVLDGTPLDGSRSIFFDAARLDVDFKDAASKLTLAYINQSTDTNRFLSPIFNDDFPLMEQDEQGAIVWLTNKSIPKTTLDGFFIYKQDDRILANGDDGEIYTVGARVAREISDHWRATAQGAYQFGNRDSITLPSNGDVSAFGFNSRLSYLFNDQYKNQLYVGYEYLSGDDPDSDTVEAFDPLWGRWPQWSELYVYSYAAETRIAETTNLHRLTFGWQCNPNNKLELCAAYHALFADENTYAGRTGFSSGGDFRGHLITAIARYKFNRFMAGHLVGEYFIPGNYYSDARDDEAIYLRAEISFAF